MEEWKSIPGYEGLYEASTHGRIRSLPRIIKTGSGGQHLRDGAVLHRTVGGSGYATIGLSKDGKVHTTTIHKIVMLTFMGPKPKNHVICHGDGDRWNNRLGNLRYATNEENAYDRIRHGTAALGSRNRSSKLTEELVAEIKSLHKKNELSRSEIAAKFGVAITTIRGIVTGRTWRHVHGAVPEPVNYGPPLFFGSESRFSKRLIPAANERPAPSTLEGYLRWYAENG